MKKKYTHDDERILDEALYCVTYHATVREISEHFGVPKSTVYDDLAKNIPEGFQTLEERVKIVLEENKKMRAINGGKAKAALKKI